MIEFGEKLRLLRTEHNLTQEELANTLNTSKQTISRYELGDIDISLDKALQIANYFKVSLDWMTGNRNK